MQETWVPSLGWKDPLEKETAAHSSILACKVPWMAEEPVKEAALVLVSVFVNKLGPFTERLRVFPEVSNGT